VSIEVADYRGCAPCLRVRLGVALTAAKAIHVGGGNAKAPSQLFQTAVRPVGTVGGGGRGVIMVSTDGCSFALIMIHLARPIHIADELCESGIIRK
jgi:hypothetical protein